MIQHIVLFRFDAAATETQIREAGEALRAMPGRIPALRSLSWGANRAATKDEWPWVLVAECDDMEAIAAYGSHPVHRETVERFIAPIKAARLAVDVEVSR